MSFLLVLVVLFVDQISKFFITRNLSIGGSFPLIKGIFHLTLVYNPGAAFGILKYQNSFFVIISSLVIILIITNIINPKFRLASDTSNRVALAFVLGGALGNLIDRVKYGYVIDFLDFRIWPVFNFADSAITIGAIIICYSCVTKGLDSNRIPKTKP